MPSDAVPLFVQWEQTVGEVLDRTAKFPKSVRFTFTGRIDNLALDVLERIVEAQYTSGQAKRRALEAIDLSLTRLRVLLRLSHERRFLSHRAYEHLMRRVDDAGRMIGGWRKEQASR